MTFLLRREEASCQVQELQFGLDEELPEKRHQKFLAVKSVLATRCLSQDRTLAKKFDNSEYQDVKRNCFSQLKIHETASIFLQRMQS